MKSWNCFPLLSAENIFAWKEIRANKKRKKSKTKSTNFWHFQRCYQYFLLCHSFWRIILLLFILIECLLYFNLSKCSACSLCSLLCRSGWVELDRLSAYVKVVRCFSFCLGVELRIELFTRRSSMAKPINMFELNYLIYGWMKINNNTDNQKHWT